MTGQRASPYTDNDGIDNRNANIAYDQKKWGRVDKLVEVEGRSWFKS